ncbi:AtpZ/AtpI family protein [Kordiimonas aestuarii]|uniref:AtpZ/AtpI family protein n=1 Tax=Kordiimonas aestuarii TaxID=1005925 RepID=UPI0021CE81F5|nr:AtpZ/AtpI family protein [Kordiimonas aestuarii]
MGLDDKDPELTSLDARLSRARQKAQSHDADVPASPLGRALTMGVHMVVGVVVGLILGVNLDEWLGTSPLFLILFLLIGFGAGLRNVIRDAMRMQADANREMEAEALKRAKRADKADKD